MRRPQRRAGATLLEIQVAMVVLAIALAGLCPLMVMQMKLLHRIESQPITDNPQVIRGLRMVDGQPYLPEGGGVSQPVLVLQPRPNDWVRRLGGASTSQLAATPQDFSPVFTESTLDDLDNDVVLSSNWTPQISVEGYAYHELASGHPNDSATWTFGSIGNGRYRVMFSWPPSIPIPVDATRVSFTPTKIEGA